MADALKIFLPNGTTEDQLRNVYAQVQGTIQKTALSSVLKNTDLSGDPQAGSVIVRRLQNAVVRDYGTARAAGEGDSLLNNGVTVDVVTRKEIVETLNDFDVRQYGYMNLIESRRQVFTDRWLAFMDTAFFAQAVTDGSSLAVTGTSIAAKVEELIQSVETTVNNNVDGVDRSRIHVILKPEFYGELRTQIDSLPNPAGGGVQAPTYHGAFVHSNHRQSVDAIVMMRGAVAQPVAVKGFGVQELENSADESLVLFFNYGTKAVYADLIRYATLSDTPSV